MRALALLLLIAAPAGAWEFSAVPVCTLSHAAQGAEVRVTYDPRLPEPYAIALTRPEAWPGAPVFGIAFEGARPLTITTDRHVLSDGGRTLTVTDRGFGNVLDGIEFGTIARAFAGGTEVALPLAGAAPEVQRFRACAQAGVA